MLRFEAYCHVLRRGALKGPGSLAPKKGLLVLLAGESPVHLDGAKLPPGGILLARQEVRVADCPAPCQWVELAGAAAEEAAGFMNGPQILPPEEVWAVEGILARLLDENARLRIQEESALAYTLLCRLCARPSGLPPLVAAALAEIQENYAQVYGIAELAADLEVSKPHLIRTFTKAVGKSPGQVLTEVRLENAKRLLLHRDLTLDMVAGLCGFSSANYMAKVFRRQLGISPSGYRKQAGAASLPPELDVPDLYL